MTRILIRSPHSPFIASHHERAILFNQINSNTGNLLFPYSLARALMTPGTDIDFTRICPPVGLQGRGAAAASRTYDCFVIPLANAFRASFAPELDRIADFVETADMPCIVVGVGLQAGVNATGEKDYSFDETVRRFMRVVLSKSDCVGVRGATTGTYLERLGFEPEKDFTVIGCPSMYLYGPELPRPRALQLSSQTKVSLNCKASLPLKIHKYMHEVARQMPDYCYAVQNTYELASLFYGVDIRQTHPRAGVIEVPEWYPTGRDNQAIREGRVVGFVDAPSWLQYLGGRDLSFGTRIHGNIAAVLAGTPTFIVAPDSRVLELARYHAIPHIRLKDLKKRRDIFSLLEGVDFDQVLEGHEQRFAHYLDFLHRNGLKTVFDDDARVDDLLPFDRKMSHVKPSGPVAMKAEPGKLDDLKLRVFGKAHKLS